MHHKWILGVTAALLLLSCNSHPTTFSQLLDDYYEEGLKLYPLKATMAGDSRYNHSFPNTLSDEYRAELRTYYSSYLEKIAQLDEDELSEGERMSKAILQWEFEVNLEHMKFRTDLFPIDQMWSDHLTIGKFAGGASAQPFQTVEDYRNWLERLENYLEWMASAESKMKEGVELGAFAD